MRYKKTCTAVKRLFVICAAFFCTIGSLPTEAQTFTVLHTFNGKNGAGPTDAPTLDSAGNIYGTTSSGGAGKCSQYGCGAAFMLNKKGKQVGVYSFDGADGLNPGASLLRAASGSFYGTTTYGGDTNCLPPYGCGTVFKVSRTGRETVLHKFTGTPDGSTPESRLIEDPAGNVYGTTGFGGAHAVGTVFRIDTAGEETILYSFTGPPGGGADGADPYTGVTRDAAGNLYGTASSGGAYGAGAVYELETSGVETLLYSFTGGSDGAQPDSALIFDSQGNLYGTTANGGNLECGGTGCGVVFELSPQSDEWSEAVLYAFCSLSGCIDGEGPDGGLSRDPAGNLYGTTYFGGNYRNCNGEACGVVFELDTSNHETVLHSFTGGTDGANPVGSSLDGSGNLYGTTQSGGTTCYVSYTCGVVFKIVP